MYRVFQWLFQWLFQFLSFIYPYNLSKKIKRLKDVVYTLWIRNFFQRFGKDSLISYPCNLQGKGWKNITIGNHTHIQRHCILASWLNHGGVTFTPSISIGNYCNIGDYTQITSCNRVVLGDGVLTGRYVLITDNAHGGLSYAESVIRPSMRNLISKGEVVIGNNVWIGDKVTILPGVHIGDNVIIGANSVVSKNIPSNSMWGGVPAKEIRRLD